MEKNGESTGLLAVDVGNSRVGLGAFLEERLEWSSRAVLADEALVKDELRTAWGRLAAAKRPCAVLGSVNPPRLSLVQGILQDELGAKTLLIRRDVPLPIELAVQEPEKVGVDRALSAAAAYERIGSAVVVASFGTAVTIDCVSEDGVFLGGAILPGLRVSAEALHREAACLPLVEPPYGGLTCVWGTNTQEAIRVGLHAGALGALREIVERYATELRFWPKLVLTGGDAAQIAADCDFADAVEPELTLFGIHLAWRRFRRGR